MYDIDFFKKTNNLKKKITSGLLKSADTEDISIELESLRKKSPHIYNIETTNYCNMKCVMCPRTMFMTRKNIWIDDKLFENLITDIKSHAQKNLENFVDKKNQKLSAIFWIRNPPSPNHHRHPLGR